MGKRVVVAWVEDGRGRYRARAGAWQLLARLDSTGWTASAERCEPRAFFDEEGLPDAEAAKGAAERFARWAEGEARAREAAVAPGGSDG
jgi:hypothetical protein